MTYALTIDSCSGSRVGCNPAPISRCYAGDTPATTAAWSYYGEMTWRSTRAAVCAYVAAQ